MCTRAILAVFLFALTATATLAETARVKSGEHRGFTRLVVELDGTAEWELGRVEQGYELRIHREDLEFETARVFDFIPATRITGFQRPGPGRLVIATGCACYADAFVTAKGDIVLDIRDGDAPAFSAFELPLAGLTYAQADLPVAGDGAGRASILPLQGRNTDLAPLFLRPPPADTADAQINSWQSETREELPTGPLPEAPDLPNLSLEMPALTMPAPTTVPNPGEERPFDKSGMETVELPAPQPSARSTGRSLFGDQFRSLAVPEILATPPSEDDRARVLQAQSALVQQLQKAVAQGLIAIPQSDIDIPQIADETAEAEAAEPVPAPEPPPDDLDHVFVETAADRDALNPVVQALRRNQIQNCLPPAIFDVAGWGPDPEYGHWFDDIRGALVGEFDRPREDVIIRMARRYVYFGFGAESLALLDAFEVRSNDANVIRELASLIDEHPGIARPVTESQAGCSSPAALWSMLAQNEPVDIVQMDKDAVLRSFSALPQHLRNHLGLELARRFIRVDDHVAARSIRGYMDRGGVADPVALNMIDAQLALAEDAVAEASPILETVIAEDGPDAAIALAELIENRSRAGLEISADLARSADALAVEYRGTDIGSRMVKASIRAYSVSGQPEVTFARIDDAVASGSITAAEARQLQAEAHLQSAARSDDVTFLRLVYQYSFPPDIGPPVEATARRAVAGRLTESGFPDRARQTLDPLEAAMQTEDREILADIALAQGNPAAALDILQADPELAQSERAALAWEQAGELARAAVVRAELGMQEAALRLAERAGDWSALLSAENPVLQDAARLAKDTQEIPVPSRPATEAEQPLAEARSLVERSAEARRILSELMNSDRGS